MKVLFLFSAVVFLALEVRSGPLETPDKVRYDNYQVYRITPRSEAELTLVSDLEEHFPEISFWNEARKVGIPIDVMIPPNLQPEIVTTLQSAGLSVHEPWIADVQKLIDEIDAANTAATAPSPKLSWDAYYDYQSVLTSDDDNLSIILSWLDEQVALHPNVSSLQTYGQTFEGRELKVIKISTGGNGQRPVIFIDANIHAREWITNAVATYIINQLLNGNESEGLKGWLNVFDFHIVPVLNPDGYDFTWTTNRMWRKTRSNYAGATCFGADANRNYAFMWNSGGASSVCSSDTFMGVAPFSEPETKAISDYFTSISSRASAYISLHSYTQLLLIPFGTGVNGTSRIPDHDNHMRVGNLVHDAIARRYGTEYEVGNWEEVLYKSSGTSMDWAKGVHNTTLAFTFELRDKGEYGFLLPPEQIVPTALELIDGLEVVCDQLQYQLKL